MKKQLQQTDIRILLGRGCLIIIGISFLLFLYRYNQIEKISLYETEGREFAKAKVVKVIQDNEEKNGIYIGNQIVLLEVKSGKWKGMEMEAFGSSGFLFGTHCSAGKNVIALISESEGEFAVSVYSTDREWAIYAMAGAFVLILIAIGGKKGLYSVVGLAFTALCVLFLFLPMIYRGNSPILSALLVVAVTTVATMYLIGGMTKKSLAAVAGTIGGVMISVLFAFLFSRMSEITGWNVPDIEDLIYIRDQTDIQVGQLLFAGILIAALGAVMDVAMSISSTIEEISLQRPELSARELFISGMHVGKDMMGTMSNTLILAFAGGSVNTLVFLYAYHYQYLQIINMYSVGIELIRGIASSIGVILTVPITSLIAAWGHAHS